MDSLVKMGDYYLLGLGSALSTENAAACYQAASDAGASAQAMWNLGWMHENGVGIEQDFHLAKRFYDQALETNPKEAYAPVKLSLWRLRWRSWWNKVTRGNIHGIEEDGEEEGGRRPRSFMEWFRDFAAADEEQMRRLYGDAIDGGEGQGAADDYDGGGMPGGDIAGEDIALEDDLLELLLIAGLVATLAWLLWYRGQQQQRAAEERRRQEQGAGPQDGVPAPAAPGLQADGGFFPPRDDPNFNAWVAGGVGH
ncbi:MAG: sel1 repeat family protein [Rhodospirillales bacterium]|nr:sel1 repeat family protein [Acetobacter sp.]